MYRRYKMINKLKVGYFVISSRYLEITVQRFRHFPWKVTSPIHWRREEVEREMSVSSVISPEAIRNHRSVPRGKIKKNRRLFSNG